MSSILYDADKLSTTEWIFGVWGGCWVDEQKKSGFSVKNDLLINKDAYFIN